MTKLGAQKNYALKKILFTGNDLNDYHVMKSCGFSACPSDSHKSIKDIASFVLSVKGGDGVIRELMESIFKLNLLEILYS